MKITANQTDTRNDHGLQLSLRDQQNAALSPTRRPIPKQQTTAASSGEQAYSSRSDTYSSGFSKNSGAYVQAIRAYQEAARFEENRASGFPIGNIFGKESIENNERALTHILREEPLNGSAWTDLGLLYHAQGNRDKVSAIYQILKEIDPAKSDAFATSVGLQEKMLFTVA